MKNYVTNITGAIFLLFSSLLSGQDEQISLANVCSYFGEDMPTSVYTFASDSQAEDVVNEILKKTGLPKNFIVKAAGVPNAAAVIRGSSRYILYNQSFVRDMVSQTGSSWAPYSIMAHEIGHHLSGHTLTNGGSRPSLELEADKFSGYVLSRLGASLSDSKLALQQLAPVIGSNSHPPKHDRLAALTNGWIEACDKSNCDSTDNIELRNLDLEIVTRPIRLIATPDGYPITDHIGTVIQTWLQLLGYESGVIDGVIGETTMTAIAQWQFDYNQNRTDGIITKQQIGFLKELASRVSNRINKNEE